MAFCNKYVIGLTLLAGIVLMLVSFTAEYWFADDLMFAHDRTNTMVYQGLMLGLGSLFSVAGAIALAVNGKQNKVFLGIYVVMFLAILALGVNHALQLSEAMQTTGDNADAYRRTATSLRLTGELERLGPFELQPSNVEHMAAARVGSYAAYGLAGAGALGLWCANGASRSGPPACWMLPGPATDSAGSQTPVTGPGRAGVAKPLAIKANPDTWADDTGREFVDCLDKVLPVEKHQRFGLHTDRLAKAETLQTSITPLEPVQSRTHPRVVENTERDIVGSPTATVSYGLYF